MPFSIIVNSLQVRSFGSDGLPFVFHQNDSSSPRSSDTALDYDILGDFWSPRKDTDSGVSSGSPLSHSPAASQSSNSSLSPRQQSPVGWQHGSEADLIWRTFSEDSNALPPPPNITDTAPIWGPHHGNTDLVSSFFFLCYLIHVLLHCTRTFSRGTDNYSTRYAR